MTPVRPSPMDLSVKNGGPGCYTWYQGYVADQAQADYMELSRILNYWPKAVICARTAGAVDAAQQSVAGMSRQFTAFFPIYVSRTILPRGEWLIPNQPSQYGHYYNDEWLALMQLRTGLLGRVPPANLTPELEVILNISIVSGKIHEGNIALRLPPKEPFSYTKALYDVIDTSRPMVPPNATQVALLNAAELAHQTGGDVSGTQFAFEASALPGQRHFFQIPPFCGGLIDPVWTPAEAAKLTTLTDTFHQQWSAAVRNGNQGEAYVNGLFHATAHVMRAIGSDDRLQVVLPHPGISIENSPHETTRQVLARL